MALFHFSSILENNRKLKIFHKKLKYQSELYKYPFFFISLLTDLTYSNIVNSYITINIYKRIVVPIIVVIKKALIM